jgi:hypothetical protein
MNEPIPAPIRPLAVTIVAVVLCLSIAGSLFVASDLIPTFAKAYGSWYVPVWFTSLAVMLLAAVGYWRMRRWGVYLYAVAFALGTLLGVIAGLPFTITSVLVPMVVIGIGVVYFVRMS